MMSFSLAENFLKRDQRDNFPGGDDSLREEMLSYPKRWFLIIWGLLILCVVFMTAFGLSLGVYPIPGVSNLLPNFLVTSIEDMTRESDLAAPFDTLFFSAFVLFEAGQIFWASKVVAKAFGAWRLLILDKDTVADLQRQVSRLEDEKKSLQWDSEHLTKAFLQTREGSISGNYAVAEVLSPLSLEDANFDHSGTLAKIYRSDVEALGDAVIESQSAAQKKEFNDDDLGREIENLKAKLEASQRNNVRILKSLDEVTDKALDGLSAFSLTQAVSDRLERDEVTNHHTKQLFIDILDKFPEVVPEIQALAYTTEEHKRINQYETIMQLYNEKIAKVRAQEMDEEDRDDAIAHWKRLRDTEIEELTRASDV